MSNIKPTSGKLNGPLAVRQDELLEMATRYLNAGLTPVRLDPKSKTHQQLGQRKKNIITADNIDRLLDGKAYNLGILHGPDHGDIIDIDLDWPEARAIARTVFGELGLPGFGRPSACGSHLLAICPGLEHRDFVLPPVCKDDPRFPKGDGEHQLSVLQ